APRIAMTGIVSSFWLTLETLNALTSLIAPPLPERAPAMTSTSAAAFTSLVRERRRRADRRALNATITTATSTTIQKPRYALASARTLAQIPTAIHVPAHAIAAALAITM